MKNLVDILFLKLESKILHNTCPLLSLLNNGITWRDLTTKDSYASLSCHEHCINCYLDLSNSIIGVSLVGVSA